MSALALPRPGALMLRRRQVARGGSAARAEAAAPFALAAALQRLHAEPLRPRVPLVVRAQIVGSVEEGVFERLAGGLPEGFGLWRIGRAWALDGDDEALHTLALALRAQGLCGPWRDERLAVRDAQGRRLGAIERGTARVLGLHTQAVHLIGRTERGEFWVQQRAHTKAEDPGLWDTLVGGLVADGESALEALTRETDEEAGLRLDALTGLRRGPSIHVRCPAPDAHGRGWRDEQLDSLIATVPERLAPVNRDGEVAAFARLSRTELLQWLREGRFTADASALLGLVCGAEDS